LKRFLLVTVAISFVALRAVPVAAQNSLDITGVVLDSTRSELPRATVRLIDSGAAAVAVTSTDSHGRFRFRGVPRGIYQAEASLDGFESATAAASPSAVLEMVLKVAPVRESIVVTATRTEAPTAQIGSSVTVMGKEEIAERAAVSIGELLGAVPGATVAQNGGMGTVTSLFVRGGESNYNKVFLDGIPLNEPGGAFNFSNTTPDHLERVEVVRGPQSALFGSDAMTSVVQLFTARGEGEGRRPRLSWSAEGGKNSTWRTQASIGGKAGALDYSFDWARLSTENQTPNNAFHNTTAAANLGISLGERTTLRAILRGDLGRTGTPGQTAFEPADRDAFFRHGDGAAGATLRNQTTRFWEQRLTVSFAQLRQVSRNLIADPPFTPQFEGRTAPFEFSDYTFDLLNNTRRQHVSYQSDWRGGSAGRALGQHVFTLAYDWDREQGAIGDRLFGDPLTQARRDNMGWTLQHQAAWRRVFVTNGVRVEDNGSFGTTAVPRSSIAYQLRQGGATLGNVMGATKLKFNFGLGINEPTFVESFSTSPFFLGNPNLAPERVRSFDFGVEQRWFRDRAKVEMNWFDNRFREKIDFASIPGKPFEGSFFNIGRSKAKGAEAIAEVAPGGGWRIRASYTYLDSEITRSTNPASAIYREGQGLLRRPRHAGAVEVVWNWRGLNVTSSTVFVGRRVDSDFASLVPPLTSNAGYAKWDLAWSVRTKYRITYFGAAENLLNRSYMDVLGYPALKFTVRAGVRGEF